MRLCLRVLCSTRLSCDSRRQHAGSRVRQASSWLVSYCHSLRPAVLLTQEVVRQRSGRALAQRRALLSHSLVRLTPLASDFLLTVASVRGPRWGWFNCDLSLSLSLDSL